VTTMTLAHGGTVGLIFEVGFLAVPILVFTVMAVVSSRRAKREEGQEPEVEA
jgi:hypothetical protein